MQAIDGHQPKLCNRQWRKFTFSLIMLICLMVTLFGCEPDSDTWEQIKASGTLRIGVDPTFPPFALAQNDTLEGIDIDLGRALAADLGLEPQFTYFGYDGLYDALTTGQVDVLLSALVIMPERTKDIAYTIPYFDAGLILIVPTSNANIKGMDDLEGHSVAVELGALGHVEALEWQRKLNWLTVNTYPEAQEAIRALADGYVDAALVDSIGGRQSLDSQEFADSTLRYLANPVQSEPYALAVRIEDRNLFSKLNDALALMIDDGRLQNIIDNHLGP